MGLKHWVSETEEIFHFLPRFAKSPRISIRSLVVWSWPNILILQLGLSLIAGAICGVLSGTFFGLIGNTILTPLQNLALDLLLSAIIYALLKFRYGLQPDEKQIFQTIVVAQVPLTLLHSLKAFDFPSTVVGLLFTMVLLYEGIPSQFKVPKPDFRKCLMGIYGVFFVFWLVSFAAQAQEEFQFFKSVRPTENKLLEE